MLFGDKVLLRARIESDVAVLHAELYDDVQTRARTDTRAWRPLSSGSALSPFAISDPSDEFAAFSVVERSEENSLAGAAVLHMIDTHNRSAHIGISLRPAFRGRGLAVDTVRVLCDYGFRVRGLTPHLQSRHCVTTRPMIRTAEHAGFVREGVFERPRG